MRRTLVLGLILLGILATSCAAQDRFVLTADAIPACIIADGKSYSQIVISVTSPDGSPAPDSTEVRVGTTAGSVTTVAYTGGGRATAILTSGTTPEVALVTCSVGGASASVQVEFSSLTAGFTLSNRTIRIEGGSLAYSVERDVILGSDGVTIEYGDLNIEASSAQVSEPLGIIKAQGEVKVTRGDESLAADAFAYDIRMDRCRVLTDGESLSGQASSLFTPEKLRKSTATVETSDFAPLSADSTKTWIVSRKLTLIPREKIQFTDASIYMGNTHVVRLPHYFYDYGNRSALLDQVRYTRYEGLVADVPVYYRVTDSSSGALKLRYAQRGSDYGGYVHPRKGASLGLEQAYALGGRGEGKIFVDAISDSERSFELTHHQEFGSLLQNGRADLSLRYQPNASYAKGLYTAYLNATFSANRWDYSLSGYMGGSRIPQWDPETMQYIEYEERSTGSVRVFARPRKPLMAGKVTLSPSFCAGYGRLRNGASASGDECMYESTGLTLRSRPIGGRKLSLSLDATTDFTVAADGRTGTSLRTGLSLRRSWRGGSGSLGYTYNISSGTTANFYSSSRHMLTGNLFAGSGGRLNCNAYFGYGLDTGRLNLSSTASYRLAKDWKLRADYTLYRYRLRTSTYTYTSEMEYFKAGVYRPLGPYEVGIAWSPKGPDFWSKSGKKVWFEVGLPGAW